MRIKFRPLAQVGLLLITLVIAGGCTPISAQEIVTQGKELGEERAMNIQTMQNQNVNTQSINTADEEAIRAIPLQMADGWNQGSGAGFAAPFTETADFIAFEGTHLKGRQVIEEFHQQIFDTEVKGTRLEAEAKFVEFLSPDRAILHAVARVALPGESETSPSRDSMQLFVVRKYGSEWRVDAVLNARQLTLERQYMMDEFDALPAEAQRQVLDLIASLKQSEESSR
jgi:uncharacterized protein (TIGR02246 family)